MANDMLERVARAMFDALYADQNSDAWMDEHDKSYLDSVNIDGSVDLILAARAAIEAMRGPTKVMLGVGCDILSTPDEQRILPEFLGFAWNDMITAALSLEDGK